MDERKKKRYTIGKGIEKQEKNHITAGWEEEKMGERIAKILKGQIATSVIYILLGLCLIFMPVKTVYIICKVVFGIVLIAAGLYHVMIYLMEKANATLLDLFSGSILLVLGGFLFFNPQIVIKILPILLGAFILIDSIWSLQGCRKLKKRKRGEWKLLLLGSLLFIGLGITLVVNPFSVIKYTIIFAGWVLLCNGILDMVFMILLKKGLKEIQKLAGEAEAETKEELQKPVYEEWKGTPSNTADEVQEEVQAADVKDSDSAAEEAADQEEPGMQNTSFDN